MLKRFTLLLLNLLLLTAAFAKSDEQCLNFHSSHEDFVKANWKWRISEEKAKIREEVVFDFNEGDGVRRYGGTIKANHVKEFGTIELYHSSGMIKPDAKANIVLTHGIGGEISSSNSWIQTIQTLANNGKSKPDTTRRHIKDLGLAQPVSIRAIDLPWHRAGLEGEDLTNINQVTIYLAEYLKSVKAQQPGVPLVTVSRSASPLFMVEVLKKYPGLIDKAFFMSPAAPNKSFRFEQIRGQIEDVQHQLSMGITYRLNRPNINRFFDMCDQVGDWSPEYFKGIQAEVYITTGSRDFEVIPREKVLYQQIDDAHDNIHFVDFPDAYHELFNTKATTSPILSEEENAAEALRIQNAGRAAYEYYLRNMFK